MSGIGVIDLGERHWDAADLPRRQLIRPWWQLAAAGLVVLAVLTLTGATPAVAGFSTPLWTARAQSFAIAGDGLYTFTDGGEVRAFALRTGTPRWRWTGPGAVVGVRGLDRGVLAVDSFPAGRPGLAATSTYLLDAATGAQLATVAGSLVGPSGGNGGVFLESRSDLTADSCGAPGAPPAACLDVVGIDSRTGADRWRVPVRAGARILWDASPGQLTFAVLAADGTVRLYDSATGAVLAQVALPAPAEPDPLAFGHRTVSLLFDGVLEIVPDRAPAPAQVGGEPIDWVTLPSATLSYEGLTNDHHWRATVPLNRDTGLVTAYRCAAWICAAGGASTTLLEPATGAVVRTISRSRPFELGSLRLIALAPSGLPAGALNSELALMDPGTGVTGPVLAGDVVAIDGAGAATLVTATRPPGQRSDVIRIYPDGRFRELGSIDRVVACVISGELLACLHPRDPATPESPDRTVAVWHLPQR